MTEDFRLREWIVRPHQSCFRRGDTEVKVDPKAMQVLVRLSEDGGEVVSKEDLIKAVWEDTFVTDEVLTNAVWELRRALADDAKSPRFIQTVPRKGYRLIATVEAAIAEPLQSEEALAHALRVPQWRVVLPWLVALIVGGLAIWALIRKPAPGPEAPSRFPLATAPLVTNVWNSSVAISPDGTRLVYVAEKAGTSQLYFQEIGEVEPTPIAGTENGREPFFSPDGQWVGFVDFDEHELKKFSLLGGPVLPIYNLQGRRARWGPDNTIFFQAETASGIGIWRISAAGGTPELLIGPRSEEGEWFVGFPEVLPGGTEVLFVSQDGSRKTLRVEVLSLETGERKTLIEGGNPARYAPSGHLIYAEAGSILAAPFDLAKLELTGAPVPVVDEVRMTPVGDAHFSFSQNGTLAYVPGGEQQQGVTTLVWVDRQGKVEPITDQQRQFFGPKMSPKDDKIAIAMGAQVWVYEIERGTLAPLTSEGQNFFPIWSPDGKRLVFPSMRSGEAPNLYWKIADGSGSSERLTTSEYAQQPYSWSTDFLFFHQRRDPETGMDIYFLPIRNEGRSETEPFLETPSNEMHPALSPDGRWLAYASDVSGRYEIYVTPFPGPGPKVMISTNGGVHPAWAPSGRELFYHQGSYPTRKELFRMTAVDIVAQPELRPGKPRLLFEGPFEHRNILGRDYDVTSDGQRFVMIKPPDVSQRQQINVVLNWFDELKRLVPPN